MNPRDEIDALLNGSDPVRARAALAQLWRQSPNLATAGFVLTRFEKLREMLPFSRCKLAMLRSFTVEPAVPLLRAMAFVGGIDLNIRLGDFNTYAQEILDAAGWLYSHKPDVVILAVQTRDIAPTLWEQFADLDAAGIDVAVEQTLSQLQQLIRTFRDRSGAHLIIHSLETPTAPAMGLLDGRAGVGQAAAIERINDRLRPMARESKNVYVLELNSLIARRGVDHWRDEHKWIMARMPIAAGELVHLAHEWLRFLHPITGRVCKVLAVDLDNTLWGGVIGEDGMDGIKLDDTDPGAAFRAVQRAILDLYRRGIILAICSKNNPTEAMEAIEKHPGMILRMEHFTAIRANWQDKAANLREIAKELNVGIDSVAFLDDNPVEREWVRPSPGGNHHRLARGPDAVCGYASPIAGLRAA